LKKKYFYAVFTVIDQSSTIDPNFLYSAPLCSKKYRFL